MAQRLMIGVAVGAVAVAGVAGFAVQRAFGGGDDPAVPAVGLDLRRSVSVYDCPGQSTVGTLHEGDRVFAIAVNETTAGWLLVRDPADPGRTFWISGEVVTADESTDSLPTRACDDIVIAETAASTTTSTSTTTTTTSTPVSESSTTVVPASTVPRTTARPTVTAPPVLTTVPPTTAAPITTPPTAAPPPVTTSPPSTQPPDTQGPALSASASPTVIYEQFQAKLCSPNIAAISATASDPSGVASLRATWSFGGGGNVDLSTGIQPFGPFPAGTIAGDSQNVPITVTATDGLGNTSQTVVTVTVRKAGSC